MGGMCDKKIPHNIGEDRVKKFNFECSCSPLGQFQQMPKLGTVNTDSKSNSTVTTDADAKTIVISPPPSAITPDGRF